MPFLMRSRVPLSIHLEFTPDNGGIVQLIDFSGTLPVERQ